MIEELKRAEGLSITETLLLECLWRSSTPMTVIEIEEATDSRISESHADSLANLLLRHGLVLRRQRVKRKGGGRPPYIWSFTPKGIKTAARIFNP